MISAQALVGMDATPPTTGTILITALVMRLGAAISPQPDGIVEKQARQEQKFSSVI